MEWHLVRETAFLFLILLHHRVLACLNHHQPQPTTHHTITLLNIMSPRSITLSAEIYVRWPSCSCYPRHSLQKHHLPPEIRKNRTEPLSISILRKVNWSFFHFSFFSYFLLYSFTSSRANCDWTLPNTCLTIILTWRIAQIDSQTHSTTKQLPSTDHCAMYKRRPASLLLLLLRKFLPVENLLRSEQWNCSSSFLRNGTTPITVTSKR